jgi:hypothetical protein
MDQLIQFLIYIVIFGVVAYGLWWVCTHFGLPQPVMWVCGAILLIIILVFLSGQLGGGGVSLFPRRN